MKYSYKDMIEQARKKGVASEAVMWESIEDMEEMLCKLKEVDPKGYWKFIRKQHNILYKGHYDEDFAVYDLSEAYYTNKAGEKTNKPYWTAEQIEEATRGMSFPNGTTKWDKYVAFNIFRSDTMRSLPDDLAIKAAYEFFFEDIDYKKDGTTKVWDYMQCKRM